MPSTYDDTWYLQVTLKNNEQLFQDFFLVWWFISTRILFYVSNFTFLLRNTESGAEWKIEPIINILDNLFFNIFIFILQSTHFFVRWCELKPNITETEKKNWANYSNKIEGVWLSKKISFVLVHKMICVLKKNCGSDTRKFWEGISLVFSVFFSNKFCVSL